MALLITFLCTWTIFTKNDLNEILSRIYTTLNSINYHQYKKNTILLEYAIAGDSYLK